MKDNLNVSGDLAEISVIGGSVLLMLKFGIAVKKTPLISQFIKPKKQITRKTPKPNPSLRQRAAEISVNAVSIS